MGLSAAERQRQYRARRNADPERRAAYLQKHREKWHDDKKRGKVKNVKDLSEREKRKKQAYWRRAQRRSRERKKVTECLLTPPQSPEAHPQPRSSRQRIAAKKKVERESELYRELQTLKEKLKQQKRKTDKFRKKCERLQQDSESRRSKSRHLSRRIPVSTEVHKTLQLCKKCASTKHKHPRRVIAALVSGRILKKYKFKKRIQETLAISRKQQSHREISILSNKLKYRSLCFTLHNKVLSFLTRDENSCLAAGKSQTITRGKIKKQKRFLNDTMRNLHRRFLLESFDCKISYSLFCRMQPFWAVQPSIADRQTCLCKVHENLCFLVEKLHSLRLIRGTDLEKMAESICCDSNSKGCMYNECPDCKDRDFPVVSEGDLQAVVFFTQWTTETVLREKNKEGKKEKVSVKITAKKRTEATLQNLLELFQRQLTNFKRHLFNIQRQFTYYRELKRGMTDRECLIHVDFLENYTCKHSSKIQAEHVEPNQQQATLHAGVLHVGGVEEHVCFATISPSKEKGPAAIWSHLSPILDLVKTSCPNVTVVHFFSNGRCTQYRQKGNFYLFCTKLQQCGFQSGTWNFFEASHGKGAPDVVAGLLKRTADRIVSHGKDIRSAERFFNALVEAQTSVKLFYISENKINEATKSIPDRLPVVPSTMSIHQVVTVTSGQISYRDVSCLCSMRPTLQCQCYNSKTFTFDTRAAAPTQEDNSRNPSVIPWQSSDIVGQWCCLKYDGDIYPGVIQEPELDDIVETLAREVARKINAIFSQLSSTLLSDNQTLKARVGQLESELTAVTKNFENARMWRENVLSGCPVLFEQSGLIYTLKPFGVLKKKTDQLTEGITESSAAAGTQRGHDAATTSCSDGEEATEQLNSEAESSTVGRQGESLKDAAQDDSTTNTAESQNTDSQNTQKAEASKKAKVFVCDVCNKSFNRQLHLQKHMNTHREPFACDQCPRKFRNAATFEHHLLRHEERKSVTFKCQICNKTFKTKMHLKTHQLVHTGTRPFVCSTCGKGFKTKRNLQAHQVVHTAEKPHKCSECGESFRYAFTLQCHRSVHTGEHPYKCTVCGKAFTKRRSLRAHQSVHRGKIFTCETCGAGFTLQHNLKRHIRIHTGEKPFKCKVCGLSFIQDNKLKAHMLLHGASKSFMCDLCGKTFLYNCQLQKHQKVPHHEKHGSVMRRQARERGNRRVIYRRDRTTVDVTPLSCKTCRKGFDTPSLLKRHELIHTGDMQYNCDTCGKSFFYKATYDYHLRIHSGERPFACDVCGKAFIVHQALKSHKLQHSGEKPHKCQLCGKAFRIYASYRRHLRIHTGEKPYECEVCGVSFRQLGHVKVHMQVHTGEKPFSCSSCGLGFSDSRLLKRHNCSEKPQKLLGSTLTTS